MQWFAPKCPVAAPDKQWIEESMLWLIDEFGAATLGNTVVILPTDDFFPDQLSEDEADIQALVNRVCTYMAVNPEWVELDIFTDRSAGASRDLPLLEHSGDGAAGHYRKRRGKFVVSVESSELTDPTCLIATVAHELAHVRLLGEGRISASFADHEPLADLLTVYLGMGVFTGNSVFSFRQWTNTYTQGWQTERRGYMTEEMFGYALAAFAWMRSEVKPAWANYLEGNVSSHFKRGLKFLEKENDTLLKRL